MNKTTARIFALESITRNLDNSIEDIVTHDFANHDDEDVDKIIEEGRIIIKQLNCKKVRTVTSKRSGIRKDD